MSRSHIKVYIYGIFIIQKWFIISNSFDFILAFTNVKG